jgi:streptogrisin C
VNRERNPNFDIQFMTGSGITFDPTFTDGTYTTTVTGSVSQSTFLESTQYGTNATYLCHYGITSGRSCGTVDTKYFKPVNTNACGLQNQPCNASFVLVMGPNLACGGGDSGGPWFLLSKAAGIHKGGSPLNNSPLPGDCRAAVFSSIGWLGDPALGAALKLK